MNSINKKSHECSGQQFLNIAFGIIVLKQILFQIQKKIGMKIIF